MDFLYVYFSQNDIGKRKTSTNSAEGGGGVVQRSYLLFGLSWFSDTCNICEISKFRSKSKMLVYIYMYMYMKGNMS